MKRIVFLTTKDFEGYEHDDHHLENELIRRGFAVTTKAWEDLEDEGEDLFLVRTTWNYTDHFNEFMETLKRIEDRLMNPLSLIEWNSNKQYLDDFYQKGLKVIPLSIVSDRQGLEEGMRKLGGNDFIAKPLVSASAKGMVRFNSSTMPEISQKMILQKFHPEILDGEISLIFFKGEFAYGAKKVPKTGDIRVQEEYGGIITGYTPTDEELTMAKEFTKQIPSEWLYARVDILPGVGLMELECIEPALYFSTHEQSANLFADAIEKVW